MVATPLVLWDVDGTLVDAAGLGTRMYEVVFRSMFGRELLDVAPKAGRTDRAIISDTLALSGVPDAPAWVEPFLVALAEHVRSLEGQAGGTVRALPGAAAALAALALDGRARQSVLTGNIRPLAEVKLAALGLREGLDLCIGAYGDDHEDRAQLVEVARRRAAAVHGQFLRPAFAGTSTVVIGDTPLDVSAALSAGARAVGVATGSYPAAELMAAGADAVLPSLADTALVLETLLGYPASADSDSSRLIATSARLRPAPGRLERL
jgi:phosphoglycolate phosphatase